MAGGGEGDEAAAGLEERRDAVDEDEVAEMIGAELGFEAVGGVAEGGGHDAGVGDEDVERAALCEELAGGGADALEAREVELDDFEGGAGVFGCAADVSGGAGSFVEVAGCADYVRAVGYESAGCLNAEAGGDSGDEDAFAFEVEACEDFVRGGLCAELCCHVVLSCRAPSAGRLPAVNEEKSVCG